MCVCVKLISIDLNLDSWPLHTPQTLILSSLVMTIVLRVQGGIFVLIVDPCVTCDKYFMMVLLLFFYNLN